MCPPTFRPRISPRTSYAPLSTRQLAEAFNQPLSFDTSSVTTMYLMFGVRSARALPTQALSRAHPVHATCAATAAHPPRLPSRTSPRTPCASLLTRQLAEAFNQPLSFDTSSVTTMEWMFFVRPARALAPPSLQSGPHPVHAACTAVAPQS